MPATESLTIEIQGDSSGLSQALDDALSKVESLQSAADNASNTAQGIGSRLASVSTALQPLQQISLQLSRISQAAQTLGQQPITLNVQPALSALQSLMSAIQAVAAQLSAISPPQSGPGGGAGGPGGTSGPSPVLNAPRTSLSADSFVAPSSATLGGLGALLATSSPAGNLLPSTTSSASSPLAAISAPLVFTSASFRPQSLVPPQSLLDQPRDSTAAAQPPPIIVDAAHLPLRGSVFPASPSPFESSSTTSRASPAVESSAGASTSSRDRSAPLDQSTSTINHFGGITIEVRETADVNALMRDLRLQGLDTRHRQG